MGHGLFRKLVCYTVFGDTFRWDETIGKSAPFFYFSLTMKKILLLFLCVLSFNAIYANVTWNLSDDGTLTISGTGKMQNYYSSSDAPWYSKRATIKNIVIEKGVSSIGNYAFYGCNQITSITIPNSVTRIGNMALSNCPGLISMKVEDGNIYYDSRNNCNAIIETQSNTLLAGCKNTIIPNSVKSIGNYAFNYCSGLTSITIPNSVTSIGDGAFERCTNLASVTIPNSVTTIGENAFSYCSRLTSITIPNSVTSIGEYVFYECSKLASVTIPNSVTTIGEGAFCHCSQLASITIPESITSIERYTFFDCSSLTQITIPKSVTIIEYGAFCDCSSLKSIIIPETVTSIGESAFNLCKGLTSITSEAKTPPYCYTECFKSVKKSIPVYVPANSINAYKDADGWKDFTNIQPISVAPDLTLALTDASPNLTEGYYKNDKVTYTRNNMSVGGYATFCLPFDIDLSQTTDNFSKVYVPLNISLCKPSGSLLLLLDEVNSYSTIKAGQPFVAKCKTTNVTLKNSSEVSFEGTVSNPSATSVKVYNFDGVSAALTQKNDVDVRIGGTFSKLTGLDDDYYRAFFTNGSFGPTTSVNPFRMYVYKNDYNSLGSKITSISFDFNDETTGIKELRTTNSELPVYDLNGRAVKGNNLKSGIYIINGKKYIK